MRMCFGEYVPVPAMCALCVDAYVANVSAATVTSAGGLVTRLYKTPSMHRNARASEALLTARAVVDAHAPGSGGGSQTVKLCVLIILRLL